MLFDRQRPGLRKAVLRIVLHDEDVLPHKRRAREAVEHSLKQQVSVKGRPDFQDAPLKEALDAQRTSVRLLADEQPANQKSAEDKEQVHPGPSRARKHRLDEGKRLVQPGIWNQHVVPDHHQDGDSTQEVELDQPASPRPFPGGMHHAVGRHLKRHVLSGCVLNGQ